MTRRFFLSPRRPFPDGDGLFRHHSLGATYDGEKEVKLEGKIVQFCCEPPFLLQIEAADKEGVLQRWSMEWRSAAR